MEHHSVEINKARRFIQMLITRKIKNIYISEKLRGALKDSGNRGLVLHDAGVKDSSRATYFLSSCKDKISHEIKCEKFNVGYFGSIRKGSGSVLIYEIAKHLEKNMVDFHLFGSVKDNHYPSCQLSNLKFQGQIPHHEVHNAMKRMDVLIMPFQKEVYVAPGVNTADYMSPLKLFEYFASGVPVISSKLPVLEEVLIDKVNCLFADPENYEDWLYKLQLLRRDTSLSESIACHAKEIIDNKYNWEVRAKKIKEFLSDI